MVRQQIPYVILLIEAAAISLTSAHFFTTPPNTYVWNGGIALADRRRMDDGEL